MVRYFFTVVKICRPRYIEERDNAANSPKPKRDRFGNSVFFELCLEKINTMLIVRKTRWDGVIISLFTTRFYAEFKPISFEMDPRKNSQSRRL